MCFRVRLRMCVRVCVFDLAGFSVLELAVRALALVRKVTAGVRRVVLRRRGAPVHVHHLVHPASEAADTHVQRRGGGVGAAVAPGHHPAEEPSAPFSLAHQPASGVALATIAMEEAGVWRTASTQRAVTGEAVAIALLALP